MTFARILDGPWPIPSSRAGPPYRMLPNEIRSGTPSVVRMLIGRSQTLPSLLLPHSRSVKQLAAERARLCAENARLRAEIAALQAKPKAVGRNDPCPCGSGKKFKKCCLH